MVSKSILAILLAVVVVTAQKTEEEDRHKLIDAEERLEREALVRHNIKLSGDAPQLVIISFDKESPGTIKVLEEPTEEEVSSRAGVEREHRKEEDKQHRKWEEKDHKKVDERRKEEEKIPQEEKDIKKFSSSSKSTPFKINDVAKQLLLSGHASETFFAKRMVEFFEANPETKFQRQCFEENLQVGEDSLDFVIDLDFSPSQNKNDKLLAESPLAYFVQQVDRTPSRAYFGAVEVFIEAVTLDMKPHLTHTVLLDKETKQKYFIRGRSSGEDLSKQVEFKDDKRRLRTLWPRPTKIVSESCFRHIVKNNLGHITKQTLWNRNNGLPTVLAAKRHSKPFYTIVITDGSSRLKLEDLTDDVSRTTVIDIGNRQFLNKLSADELRKLRGNYFAFFSPHELVSSVDFCRFMACRFASHRSDKE